AEEHGLGFGTALAAVRSGTLFTTHTPVPAGIDRFSHDLVAEQFGGDNQAPGVRVEDILALGAEDYPGGDPATFNMAVMGLRLAQRANGVSVLHGAVVTEARRRVKESWIVRGASEAELGWTADVLDPDILTIGFARRVPSYKRLTLMLRDRERLTRLLLHPQHPIQLVVAGKAHP